MNNIIAKIGIGCLAIFFVCTGCLSQVPGESQISVLPTAIPSPTPTIAVASVPVTPTPVPIDELFSQTKGYESEWQSLKIEDYRIRTRTYANYANPKTVEQEIIVRNGTITSNKCLTTDCQLVDGSDAAYTIPDLFKQANKIVEWGKKSRVPSACPRIVFDKKYNFPVLMTFDCPDMFDEDMQWIVTDFEILK